MASPIQKAKDIIEKGEKATGEHWKPDGDRVYQDLPARAMPLFICDTAADTDDAAYIAAANPADLLPILRAFVEMAELRVFHSERSCCRTCARCQQEINAVLDELRSES